MTMAPHLPCTTIAQSAPVPVVALAAAVLALLSRCRNAIDARTTLSIHRFRPLFV